MEVSWVVEDGYAGGARPQSTHVPDEELEECETVEEKKKLIEEYVQTDYESTISWAITDYGIYE
jgi:hypothetical protein